MIYKSISDRIAELEAAGQIRRFMPIFDPCESEERELLMTPALYDWLYQSDRKATANYKANIRAFLGRYVKGEEVDNRDYMKSWTLEVFELRVQLNRPGNPGGYLV